MTTAPKKKPHGSTLKGQGKNAGAAMKRKGNRRERQVTNYLKALGYNTVKAGGSLGVFDIVAVNAVEVLFVQVKSNRWPSAKERQAMTAVAIPENGRKLVVRYDDFKFEPEVRDIERGPDVPRLRAYPRQSDE